MRKEYHVAMTGNDWNDGSKERPFRTIQKAATVVEAGDTVTVHEGVYRECVKPMVGGVNDRKRITFQAAKGEKVIIKGSEIIKNWENVGGTVWKTVVPNTFFGDYNPYQEELFGDWIVDPMDWRLHTGDVYLNGRSFYEARSLEEVRNPQKRIDGCNPPWTKRRELIQNPEDTIYQWFATVDEKNTTIYANFHEYNPKEELVEINVRRSCFYPEKTGCNYITVRGFEMAQAASPWAPPTADQPALLGTHWSKGWIIENNCIHDAKCSGISIGKEKSTGHNDFTYKRRKAGYQYQMEVVFKALQIGWSKETIGSHIIRNNEIYDCGQNAIVGHLGCIFSEIYGNHIYNIAVKHEFFGYEIAGIKLHTAIDVQIHNNNIHNCTLGIWLDWQAQGARISKNLFYKNDRDLFIEVTHGPHLVDNNIFASEYFFDNIAWGGAYINNLICGTMRREPVLNRATPYHYPHSTKPMGTTFVYGGDDRWYQNIFVGGSNIYTEQSVSGTTDYNGSPCSLEEYIGLVRANEKLGDLQSFEPVKDAVYMENNGYLNGANMFDREQNSIVDDYNPNVEIIEEDGNVYLQFEVNEQLKNQVGTIICSKDLGEVRIVEMPFENPDGSTLILDEDYFGEKRAEKSSIGPIGQLELGKNRRLVWEMRKYNEM